MNGPLDLTAEHGVQLYFKAKHGDSPVSVQLLTGGTANYVYRVTWKNGTTRILKHAAPYLHSNKSFAFDQARMDFEAHILEKAPTIQEAALENQIHAARLFEYDRTSKLLTIKDGGELNLKAIYDQTWLDIPEVAKFIARWLATLHTRSTTTKLLPGGYDSGNNPIAINIYRHSYNNLHIALEKFGHDVSLAERINAEFGSLLATEDECVCHGDFWPGNVLVRQIEAKDGSSSTESSANAPFTLTIVDWEMSRRGTSATDVGQFAAEAFLLDRFGGDRRLRKNFLSYYMKNREEVPSSLQIGKEWIRRMAVHWGVHVAFWPTRVEWTDSDGTQKLVDIGVQVLKYALASDWEGLRQSLLFDGVEVEINKAFERL